MTTTDTQLSETLLPIGDWQITPAASDLRFETRAIFGLVAVRGVYGGLAGELHMAADGATTGTLSIDAATVRTGIGLRDRHLRSGDFFAVEEHPHIRFELDRLRAAGDATAHLSGRLQIRGETLPIDVPVSLEQPSPNELRIAAEFDVDHRGSRLREIGSGWKKVPERLHVRAALVFERAG